MNLASFDFVVVYSLQAIMRPEAKLVIPQDNDSDVFSLFIRILSMTNTANMANMANMAKERAEREAMIQFVYSHWLLRWNVGKITLLLF